MYYALFRRRRALTSATPARSSGDSPSPLGRSQATRFGTWIVAPFMKASSTAGWMDDMRQTVLVLPSVRATESIAFTILPGPCPFAEHRNAVAKPDEPEDVNEQPDEPRQEARDFEPADVGHR